MFVKVFLLLVGLSTAYTIKCYNCVGKECTTIDCGQDFQCFSSEVLGVESKGCTPKGLCRSPLSCCEGDLCNGTGPTGPTVLLLLVSSAIFTLFL